MEGADVALSSPDRWVAYAEFLNSMLDDIGQQQREECSIPEPCEQNLPPWVRLARDDLEAASVYFAIEFANLLYPRLVGAVSYEAQIAAIRQAFVETVEAA